MKENPNEFINPKELEAKKIVKEFVDGYDKHDYINDVYPDKDALKANDIVVDLAQKIIDSKLNVPDIDGKVLAFWSNFEGGDNDPEMIDGEKQFNKLVGYVSEITGVSVERINSIGFI